jgi:hypothetical protein
MLRCGGAGVGSSLRAGLLSSMRPLPPPLPHGTSAHPLRLVTVASLGRRRSARVRRLGRTTAAARVGDGADGAGADTPEEQPEAPSAAEVAAAARARRVGAAGGQPPRRPQQHAGFQRRPAAARLEEWVKASDSWDEGPDEADAEALEAAAAVSTRSPLARATLRRAGSHGAHTRPPTRVRRLAASMEGTREVHGRRCWVLTRRARAANGFDVM